VYNNNTMNALLSNFVSKVQTKHWKNLQRRTQKLDRSEKDNLLEFLEENLAAAPTSSVVQDNYTVDASLSTQDNNGEDDDDEFEEEDYELLQRDLEKANARLEELQSKHDFLQTRLETYRSKIKAAEDFLVSNNSSGDNDGDDDGDAKPPPMSPERLEAMKEKIETSKRNLLPIEDTYRSIASELSSHQRKIESMQDRQLELKLKTQECMVVLQELSYNCGETTTASLFSDDDEIVAEIVDENEIKDREDADADTIERAVFEDEHASNDNNDLENARINREDEEEQQQQQNDEIEIKIDRTANDNKASLSIPVGTQTETE
jgi:hypothetical protein